MIRYHEQPPTEEELNWMSIKQVARRTRFSDDTVTSSIKIIVMVLQVPNEKFLGLCAKLEGEEGGQNHKILFIWFLVFEVWSTFGLSTGKPELTVLA